ncbi:MAG: PaREP1 family protein [Candidatus Hydrothermales bacterium]
MELFEKYLKEAEELHEKGDLPQAGEKYYGAISELIKMIGERTKWEHKGHRARREIILKLDEKYPELNLWTLHGSAERLHQNFYENDLTIEGFEKDVKNVKLLISYLKEILERL